MKYYKVLKDNFLWINGAILKENDNKSGYIPIEDIYYKLDDIKEYISKKIIEETPEYFQRVYPVNLLTKTIYKLKEEALEIINKIEVK